MEESLSDFFSSVFCRLYMKIADKRMSRGQRPRHDGQAVIIEYQQQKGHSL